MESDVILVVEMDGGRIQYEFVGYYLSSTAKCHSVVVHRRFGCGAGGARDGVPNRVGEYESLRAACDATDVTDYLIACAQCQYGVHRKPIG